MKKVLWSVTFVLCVAMLTGCGNSDKTLSCSKDYSSSMPSGINMVQDSNIVYKGSKIDTMDMTMKFEVSGSYESMFDTIMSTMKSTYESEYGQYDGVTVSTNKTGDLTFEVVVTVDFKNISDSTKTALGMQGSESYGVNKAELENDGYTCK